MKGIFGIIFYLSLTACTDSKREEVSPAAKLKNDHANLVMNTSIARKAYDLVSEQPGRKICGLDQEGWSKQIKKMVEQRNALPKLGPQEMDQIDRGMNHMLCDEVCYKEFCKTQL